MGSSGVAPPSGVGGGWVTVAGGGRGVACAPGRGCPRAERVSWPLLPNHSVQDRSPPSREPPRPDMRGLGWEARRLPAEPLP